MLKFKPSYSYIGLLLCNNSKISSCVISMTRQFSAIPSLDKHLNYLDGSRVSGNSSSAFTIHHPATGKVMGQCRESSSTDIDKAVESARKAQRSWKLQSGKQRGEVLITAARLIKDRLEEIAELEVHDCGKPLWEAKFDVESSADALEYFGGLAPTIAGQHIDQADGSFAYTRREPLGVCVGIGVWNFPFLTASWKVGPALACGNALVYKPSPLTPLTSVILAEILVQAGCPSGLFNILQGGGDVGELLVDHPDVDKVSFTGSVPTGSKVMATAAKGIKNVTLELGGKSPLIICQDCDLENAVKGAMMANFLSQGQVCSNGTRVFVHRSIMTEFLERLKERTEKMKIGDPFSLDTTVGATISQEHADKVLGYIESARDEGAEVICGGERVTLPEPLHGGCYLSPCVITNCTDDMKFVKEEVFGSVMAVLPYEDDDEVVARANDTTFGLAGGVFTRDVRRAHHMAREIQAGSVWINNFNIYPPELPFGGFKQSGIGRENGTAAIEHFTQVKTVYVEQGDVWSPF